MPEMIKRDFLFVALGTLGPLCTGPDQTHVAPKHIPKLRQLIEPQLPQPAPDTCYTRVLFASVEVSRLLVQVPLEHGAKFVCRKNLAFAPDARLPEDCRTPALYPNQQ